MVIAGNVTVPGVPPLLVGGGNDGIIGLPPRHIWRIGGGGWGLPQAGNRRVQEALYEK